MPPSEFVKQDWPRGVTRMTLVDERTVNDTFNAKILGVRYLLEHGWVRVHELLIRYTKRCLGTPIEGVSRYKGSKQTCESPSRGSEDTHC
jgi:hypothetical protein